jgi:oligopeptidase B
MKLLRSWWRRPPRAPRARPNGSARERLVHGHKWQDEFGWLSNHASRAVRKQLGAEAAFTKEVLRPTVGLQMVLHAEMNAALPSEGVSISESIGGWSYYTRTPHGHNLPLYCRRPAAGGTEQIVLNLGALADWYGYAALGA